MRVAKCAWLVAVFAFGMASSLSAQQHILPLWPKGNPEPSTITGPETDPTTDANRIVSGKVTVRVTNVSRPTLSVYLPTKAKNTGAAALVMPGGAYIRLAWNIEGTEVCDWLNSIGMSCLLVKYRVPETGHYPENAEDLEDAQQAMRIARSHAAEWDIDPQRIGAIGFSAGAHLAAALSTHADKNIPASTIDARPDFQMLLYPGWLNGADGKVNPTVKPVADMPPTFLVMAENDYTAHVENALVYFQALKDAKVPAELHLFTLGGHGFGLRPTELPISRWRKAGCIPSTSLALRELQDGHLLFAEPLDELLGRFREFTVTVSGAATDAGTLPQEWLRKECFGAVVRFVHPHGSSTHTEDEIRAVLPQVQLIESTPVGLREIFLALTRTRSTHPQRRSA